MILIIGYGNSLRQDDGAGLELAELLTRACHQFELPAEQLQVQQLTPELVLDIARPDVQAVIFADTRIMASDADACVQIEPLPISQVKGAVGCVPDFRKSGQTRGILGGYPPSPLCLPKSWDAPVQSDIT